jgi:hypothetical protein
MDPSVDELTAQLQKVDVKGSTSSPSTSKTNDTTKAAAYWQMAEITNTLQDRTKDKPAQMVPPHLRGRNGAAANSASATQTPASAATEKVDAKPEAVPAQPAAPPSADQKPREVATGAEVAATTKKEKEHATEAEAKKTETARTPPVVQAAPISTGTTSRGATTPEVSTLTIEKVTEMFAGVSARVKALEEENFDLQKKLEALLQVEERRKFLGTDSAKAPFNVDVQSRNWERSISRYQNLLTLFRPGLG